MRHTLSDIASVLLSTVLLLFVTPATAQTSVTVQEAGTLSDVLADTETNIQVSGPLNGTDFKYLRQLVTSKSLTTIDLSQAQVVSGGDAYYNSLTTQQNVLPECAFYQCSKLTTIKLPQGITAVGAQAFANSGITEIDIPNQVTTLGRDAFAYCKSLKTVVIGKHVAKNEQGVFYSSSVTQAYVKPMTPPNVSSYLFSSSPKIHVYAEALADYKANSWSSCGTLVGDLADTHPYEKDPEEIAREVFSGFFDDALCTQLKSNYAGMSDDELTAALTADGVTSDFVAFALKIKNNAWNTYERDFRIHSYKAYSDASYWNDKLKSTGGSYMGNPTGIYTQEGQSLIVVVGNDIPADATLYLAGCYENDLITSAKAGTKLTKGVNLITGSKDALYYVVYTADTKSMKKQLTEWPMMDIHIEGGVVNGYYELSRHDDAAYRDILGAATHHRFTVKGDESLFNFKTNTYREVWPESVDLSICWFDSLTVWEKELMGMCAPVAMGQREVYPHNLSGGDSYFPLYYNNPNFAIEGESSDAGYANSVPYRTSYNSVDCIRKSFDPTIDMDDNCAAHECGHNNQSTISIEGCTEVSNNLFSQVIRFMDGMVTSNGPAPTTILDEYTRREPYYTRDINSRIRMYYQLYLYFHQARKNTAFYPTLFHELRKSPLSLYQSNNYNGGLKFVRLACKVAQQDLSDFFRAYGFFEPCQLTINDYGTYKMTVRQTDIDKTLAEISQYPKNREILFVEDRIDYVLSTGFPTAAGQKRRESERVGQCGDLGQFTDYMTTPVPANYTYTQTDSLYSMKGTGGVGFVVLDSEDNLLYGSNSFTFCIPSSVGTDFTIYAIDADGTLHPTERGGDGLQQVDMIFAGTLSNKLTTDAIKVIITGPINGTDVKYLRQLNDEYSLVHIDLSGASIRQGGLAYYESNKTTNNVIGESMFQGCGKLLNIVLPTNIVRVASQAFVNTGISRIEIPNSVLTINRDACAYCNNLTEVIVGEKVKTIEQGAFYSSPVKNIYVKPVTPPNVSSYLLSSNPIIHVHKSSLAAYQASAWNDYGALVGDLDEWEEATSVTLPQADHHQQPTYNLTGQRVSAAHPGVLIRDGKKYIVR